MVLGLDDILRHLLMYPPRRCDMAQVSRAWKEIVYRLPMRRLSTPKLPTVVNIELCSNLVVFQREVFVLQQELWAKPLEINRFMMVPSLLVDDTSGKGRRNLGEWLVEPDNDQKVGLTWRTASKLCSGLLEFSGRVCNEYPHFCEINDESRVTFRGYISEESVDDLLCGVKDSITSASS